MPSSRESPGAREKRKLRLDLKKMGYEPLSLHGNQYQQGWPDLMCLMYGMAIFVEIKTPGDTLKKIQKKQLEKIRAQGCIAFIAESRNEAMEMIYTFLDDFVFTEKIIPLPARTAAEDYRARISKFL